MEDKKNRTFDPIHMFMDKLGGIELPHPQISRLKKIQNYLQYMQFLNIKSKLYQVFGYDLMQKEYYAVQNAFLMKSKASSGFLKTVLAFGVKFQDY